jgi:hypothetical protein
MKQKPLPTGGMHRRDFLMLGSVATVGVAASMSASTNGALAALVQRQQLSVGFAEPATGDAQRVRRADHLRSGETDFVAATARVTVHGLWQPQGRRNRSANVAVSVFHTVGEATVPFLAWQHSGRSSAARVSFNTPVQPDGTLPIGIERSRSFSILAEPGRRFSRLFRTIPANGMVLPAQETLNGSGNLCSLAATGGSGLKLRRGTYFVALLDGASHPRWNSITAGANLNPRSESVLRIGDAPVDFEYLVISVDRA